MVVKLITFKYGYLDVRQRITMNVGFADPQLTQRVTKLFDPYKERIKWENRKNSHRQTDTDLHYDQIKAGHVSWKQ